MGGATGGTSDLLDQFGLMSASQAQNGFEQIAGDIYGSGMQVNFLGTTHLNAMIAAQLRGSLGSGQGPSSSQGSRPERHSRMSNWLATNLQFAMTSTRIAVAKRSHGALGPRLRTRRFL